MGGLLGGPKGMLAPTLKLLGGPGPPWPPLFLRLCVELRREKPISRARLKAACSADRIFFIDIPMLFFRETYVLCTVKILKFGTPQTIAIIVLKIETFNVTLH